MDFQWLLDVWMLTSPAIGLHVFTLDQWVAWQWFHIDFLYFFHAFGLVGVGHLSA